MFRVDLFAWICCVLKAHSFEARLTVPRTADYKPIMVALVLWLLGFLFINSSKPVAIFALEPHIQCRRGRS
jgi:hypothetical protein